MSILFKHLKPRTPKAPRNKCGVNGFQCGKCKRCKDAEDFRWTRIWEERYGEQEKAYYAPHPERQSLTPSTMDYDLPIDKGDYTEVFAKLRPRSGVKAAGRGSAKVRKNEATSPASLES